MLNDVDRLRLRLTARRALVAAATALFFFTPGDANANGRFPASSALIIAPKDPQTMIMRSTFGVLLSRDQGVNWDWICEAAIGYGGIEDPTIAITESNTIVAGTFEGLAISPDTGCAWSFMGGDLDKKTVIDTTLRVSLPTTAIAMTSAYTGDDGGLPTYLSQLWQS